MAKLGSSAAVLCRLQLKWAAALQVLGVVKAAGPGLTSARAWRTICDLLSRMALHPEAAPIAMDALQLAAAPEQLSVASFIPVLECASQIAERNCTVSLYTVLLPETKKT